ncbi:hypothetical protein GIB67_022463 [Kingdonia uniflora]|uniref:Fe2OG dioxygenase domain-containing protein n=1 Tax=Kingdonia uniflora TaxID=39325 RepID=A0A7J7MU29_9MAGN|nr:hypothetical protein GIB67_022463 [Kingdonia uniflora]
MELVIRRKKEIERIRRKVFQLIKIFKLTTSLNKGKEPMREPISIPASVLQGNRGVGGTSSVNVDAELCFGLSGDAGNAVNSGDGNSDFFGTPLNSLGLIPFKMHEQCADMVDEDHLVDKNSDEIDTTIREINKEPWQTVKRNMKQSFKKATSRVEPKIKPTSENSRKLGLKSFQMNIISNKWPRSVTKDAESLLRIFLWTGNPVEKKSFTMLGLKCVNLWLRVVIRRLYDMNMAMLMKQARNVYSGASEWAIFMRSKFLSRWLTGDGASIDVWRDYWASGQPIKDLCPTAKNSKVTHSFLNDFIVDGHWNFSGEMLQLLSLVGIDPEAVPIVQGFHVDDSEVTLNVCLGKQFSGGELFFRGIRCDNHVNTDTQTEEILDYSHIPGHAVLHRGRHRHGARATTSGHRINLLIWCRRFVCELMPGLVSDERLMICPRFRPSPIGLGSGYGADPVIDAVAHTITVVAQAISAFRELKKYQKEFPNWCAECQRDKKERQRKMVAATRLELVRTLENPSVK